MVYGLIKGKLIALKWLYVFIITASYVESSTVFGTAVVLSPYQWKTDDGKRFVLETTLNYWHNKQVTQSLVFLFEVFRHIKLKVKPVRPVIINILLPSRPGMCLCVIR